MSDDDEMELYEEQLKFTDSLLTELYGENKPVLPYPPMKPVIVQAPITSTSGYVYYFDFITNSPRSQLFSIGVEDKINVGTFSPLTVVLQLDPNLRSEEICIGQAFVPSSCQRLIPNAKYIMLFNFYGENSEGKKVDLTFSRCDKCKSKMKLKNKEDSESDRFCDIMSNAIIQTRRIEGVTIKHKNVEANLL